jgi:dipeptidyl aminopeptidase/acylaminoacyl peptidase
MVGLLAGLHGPLAAGGDYVAGRDNCVTAAPVMIAAVSEPESVPEPVLEPVPAMLEPQHLAALSFVSDPQISDDGLLSAAVMTSISDGRYCSGFLIEKNGQWSLPSAPTRRDYAPRFAPDGQSLVFARLELGERPQLWWRSLMAEGQPGEGPSERQLTMLRSGIDAAQWSPDGRFVAFLSRGSEWSMPSRDDRGQVVTQLRSKANLLPGSGLIGAAPLALWLCEVASGELRQLSQHPVDIEHLTWLPDSSALLVITAKDQDHQAQQLQQVWILGLDGDLQPLTNWSGALAQPSIHPDGRRVAVIGVPYEGVGALDAHVYGFELSRGSLQRLERLDQATPFPVTNSVAGDTQFGGYPAPLVWQNDGKILALYTIHGAGVIKSIDPSGKMQPVVALTASNISSFAASATGRVLGVRASASEIGELFAIDLKLGQAATITSLNAQLRQTVPVFASEISRELEHIQLKRDGHTIEGWLLRPSHWQAGQKYPVVLSIHGGPHTAYGHEFFFEFQMLASQGFAVLFCNIRGSTGYGEQQTAATLGDYCGEDYQDLMAFYDLALDQYPWLDGNRAAVTGGSYGGLMVNWTITQHQRFKAAITDRTICNWLSFYGTSDIGYRFVYRELAGRVPQDFAKLWQMSPLRLSDQVKTPCLIIHGEEDQRCPIEQAEQWFVALKERGVETRFVRFPGENHELSRSGRPDRRIQRLEEMLAWLRQHL